MGSTLASRRPTVLASVVTPRYQMGVETARLLLSAAENPAARQVLDLGFDIRLGESI
jgi:DNA-binding LacI/PurR family transcriptional regulator